MKKFETDSVVVARARADLQTTIDQFVDARKSLRNLAKRLHRAKKRAEVIGIDPFDGEKLTAEEWFAGDIESICSDKINTAIKGLRCSVTRNFYSEVEEMVENLEKEKIEKDRVAYLVAEIKRCKGEGLSVTELRKELIPLTNDPVPPYRRLKGRAEKFAQMSFGLTASELEEARGCRT